MTQDLNYFKYKLPSEPVEQYVDKAVRVLIEIKNRFPQFYENFRCPSEVLTLSGVRSFDTYYELGKNAKTEQIRELKKLLREHGVLLIEETFEVANEPNTNHSYSLVHTKALREIPKYYGHLPAPGWNEPNLLAMEKETDFYLWWFLWQFSITAQIDSDPVLKAWHMNDASAFHNITFGILLGYPGEAICSGMYETELDYEKGSVMQANIVFSDAYDGARPVYQYLENVAEDRNIKAHENLWSAILAGVYSILEPDLRSGGTPNQ